MENYEIIHPQCIVDGEDVYDLIYDKTVVMTDTRLHYCPGCGHSTAHKILAEVIDELGITENVIGVAPVGCSVFAYNYVDID